MGDGERLKNDRGTLKADSDMAKNGSFNNDEAIKGDRKM